MSLEREFERRLLWDILENGVLVTMPFAFYDDDYASQPWYAKYLLVPDENGEHSLDLLTLSEFKPIYGDGAEDLVDFLFGAGYDEAINEYAVVKTHGSAWGVVLEKAKAFFSVRVRTVAKMALYIISDGERVACGIAGADGVYAWVSADRALRLFALDPSAFAEELAGLLKDVMDRLSYWLYPRALF